MADAVKEPAQFRAALEAVGGALERAGVAWWIQDGTLLGAVRNGGPVPGDKDIDIGIFAAEFRPSLVEALKLAGLSVSRVRRSDFRRRLFVRVRHQGFPVDIFGMYPRGDRWSYTVLHRWVRIDNLFTPFRIGRVRFMGVEVPCPTPAEQYLTEAYGPEWRVPVSDWHCAFSPQNLHIVGGALTRLYYRHRRRVWLRRVASRRLGSPTPVLSVQSKSA